MASLALPTERLCFERPCVYRKQAVRMDDPEASWLLSARQADSASRTAINKASSRVVLGRRGGEPEHDPSLFIVLSDKNAVRVAEQR